jgi:hypothetical protein
MSKGHDYELDLKNAVIEDTTEFVTAMRPDYSGNSKHSVADIRVTVDKGVRFGDGTVEDYYVEAKKRQGEAGYRRVVMSGSSQGDENGLGELWRLVNESPPWAETRLMVKFDHREAITLDAKKLAMYLEDPEIEYEKAERHEVALTPANNISMVKPELDDWSSATAGMPDHLKLLSACNIGDYFIERGDR